MFNRKIKKTISALMAAVLLSGCSGGGNSSPDNSENNDPINSGVEAVTYKFEGSAAADSELYVEPIAGLTDSFIRGADVSTYLSQKESGVTYKGIVW